MVDLNEFGFSVAKYRIVFQQKGKYEMDHPGNPVLVPSPKVGAGLGAGKRKFFSQ